MSEEGVQIMTQMNMSVQALVSVMKRRQTMKEAEIEMRQKRAAPTKG